MVSSSGGVVTKGLSVMNDDNQTGELLARRGFFRRGGACLAGVAMSSWLGELALRAAIVGKRPKRCILLWMDGGASHLDTFDPKPGAPSGVRGPLKAIGTDTPGVQISELFPAMARQMKHAAILRSMSTVEGDHLRARYYLHTSYRQTAGTLVHPSLGAVLSKELGRSDFPLPNYVLLKDGSGRSYGTAAGFLGPRRQPLVVGDIEGGVKYSKPRVKEAEFEQRLELWREMERDFAQRYATPVATATHHGRQAREPSAADAHRTTVERAVRMMRSAEMRRIDVSDEPARTRERYGETAFGKCCLAARRLVEAGATCVEVNSSGWDHHGKIYTDMEKGIRPLAAMVDRGMAALLSDLAERGLLESTLVCWMGEFGRTPGINAGAGRDHHARAWSVVLAGGGIRGGQVIGKTDASGEHVLDRPVTGPDLMATIYKILDVDFTQELVGPGERPIPIVANQKAAPKPVEELWG